ncbi:hypothetical protein SIN8267_02872 [Sinobacterium norvegicum]|uniref:DUF58 domain-containing protein n=1 Tax=Sinobacterium norvegicum TaxID=1641715 RepID=A0ABM9AHR0_9GAMM|nr:DUF58 domain-containing protein [Sinobacterium norvegicum]CAH0992736.1 hypothetical protein SIN8267_02872 [Sinobacterium norvegicum]
MKQPVYQPQGVSLQWQQLAELRFVARQLELTPNHRHLSQLTGAYRTRLRGRGIDFAEVRSYQPGDDVRHIDWRVTARSNQPHTKIFTEERDRNVIVFCDQRSNMAFGSSQCFKSVMAAAVASLISWSALAGNDKIGGMIAGNTIHSYKPKRGQKGLLRGLQWMAQCNQDLLSDATSAPQSLAHCFAELNQISKPGSSIYIISDFHDLDSAAFQQLHRISKHCELHAIQTLDPMEKQLPNQGRFRITDGQNHATLAADKHLQQRYSADYDHQQEQLKQQLASIHTPLIEIFTNQEPLAVLQYYFAIKSLGVKVKRGRL